MRRGWLLLALVAALPVPVGAVRAQSPAPGAALVEVCTDLGVPGIPELGPRTCRSIDAGSTLFAMLCAQLPVPPELCGSLTDGHVVDPAAVDAFADSWTGRALRLQDRLDDTEPLRNTLWLHTHNSANATAYPPSVANADPNQRYSIFDQLRMGVRAIELDLHHMLGDVVLCHGRSVPVGPVILHVGCSIDRPVEAGLAEIRAFLDLPGNEDEFLLLYLENQLDDDLGAHEQAAAAVQAALGDDLVPTPPGEPCAPMPLDATVADLRAAGHRVLVVGNCGPGTWGTLVHERGPDWEETGSGGQGFPAGDGCLAAREAGTFDDRFVRIYEDSTWLTAVVGGVDPPISPTDVRNMVACGVDMVGFDRLEPGDGRLAAAVWSWAPDEPADDPARRCAARGDDGRFRMQPCGEGRSFSCRTAGGGWIVPAAQGPWAAGAAACAAAGAAFATPPTGWENGRLGAAAAAAGAVDLWLPIGGPGSEPPPPASRPVAGAPQPTAGGGGPTLPATGGGPALLAGLAAGAAGLATRAARRDRRRSAPR